MQYRQRSLHRSVTEMRRYEMWCPNASSTARTYAAARAISTPGARILFIVPARAAHAPHKSGTGFQPVNQ